MLSDPDHEINLAPCLLWTFLSFTGLQPRRAVPREEQRFYLCGLLLFAIVMLVAAWQPAIRKAGTWRVLNSGGIGLSFIAVGLYQHITLSSLLPKRTAEGDDE
jgi:hypothetical protein